MLRFMETTPQAALDPQLQLEAAATYRIIDGNIVIQQSLRNQLPLIIVFFICILGAGAVNTYFPGAALLLLSLLPALICLGAIGYRVMNSRVVLSPNYLLFIEGILAWRQRSIRLDYTRVQEIELRETILQRMLGIGDVVATPISTSMEEMIALNGVLHPRLYKDLIRERIGQVPVDVGVTTSPNAPADVERGERQ